MSRVIILGGGPAGAAAAIAARREGARALLIEKSRFPRHKVCGEFFSPEIAPALEELGVWQTFLEARPAVVRRMMINFGAREKSAPLPEPGWGLSRFAFDKLMLESADAEVVRASNERPSVIASGRRAATKRRGRRLFGFKTHFAGPVYDAVELYFFKRFYVGVSPVEGGLTNVCGLGPEHLLSQTGFDYDQVVSGCDALRRRLEPLTRSMEWLSAGPIEFRQHFNSQDDAYRAGDALSFVDPFTGSGLVAAVQTGNLAGRAVTRGVAHAEFLKECRASLARPFEIASVLRTIAASGLGRYMIEFAPLRWLFSLTRPRSSA